MSLSADIDRAKDSLINTFELAQEYGTEDVTNPADYLKMAEDLISIKEMEKRCNEALEKANNDSNLPDFDKMYELELEKRNKRLNIKNTSEYKSFANTLQSKISSREEVQFILNLKVNANDPITMKRIQNPVKNILCGHHYEQNTILAMIKDNSNFRCPVAGCGNTNFVTKDHLEFDHEFLQQIQATVDEEEND